MCPFPLLDRIRRWFELGHRRQFLPVSVVAALLFLSIPITAVAQDATPPPSVCDPGLEGDSKSPLAYRMRGTRCEGEFVVQVNNSPDLQLVSLVQVFEDFDPQKRHLEIAWSPPPETHGDLHLRVLSLKPRTFYRMDAVLEPAATPYLWPTDVLAALDISRRDLGAIAWTSRPAQREAAGDDETLVYLPLRLHQRGTRTQDDRYHVSFLPSQKLDEVYVTLEPVDTEGRSGPAILSDHPLGYGYYPTDSVTQLDTPVLTEAGLYRLTLGARLHSGGSATKAFLFYHSTL